MFLPNPTSQENSQGWGRGERSPVKSTSLSLGSVKFFYSSEESMCSKGSSTLIQTKQRFPEEGRDASKGKGLPKGKSKLALTCN